MVNVFMQFKMEDYSMSVMDKFLNAMKLNDEEDDFYDDDY